MRLNHSTTPVLRISASSASCLLLLLCLPVLGCKKAGEGGDASIKGYVHVKRFNSTFTQYVNEYPGKTVDVYIQYGDRKIGYDDRQEADYNGNFEFRYLYEGDYTIYAYSKDSTLTDPSGTVAVVKHVNISERKQQAIIDTLLVYQVK